MNNENNNLNQQNQFAGYNQSTMSPNPGQNNNVNAANQNIVNSNINNGNASNTFNQQTNIGSVSAQTNYSNYSQNTTANQTGFVPSSSPKFNFDKKFLALGGIVLGAIVLIFFVAKLFGGSNGKEYNAIKLLYDVKKPIMVEKDDKFGFVTYEGKKLIDIKYDYAEEFYGDYAVVGIKDNDYDYSPSKYQIIDKKGKVKLETSLSEPIYYPEYGLWLIDNLLYNSKFKIAFEKGITYDYISDGYFSYMDPIKRETGIIKYDGKKVFSWKHSEIDVDIEVASLDLEHKDVYAVVDNNEDIEAIVSLKTGKIVYQVPDADDYYIYAEGDNLFNINNYDTDEESWIFIKKGKIVYQADNIYDVSVYDYDKGILKLNYGYDVDRDERYKYYDTSSKKMLSKEPSLDTVEELANRLLEENYGYRVYECDGDYGLIKKDDILISCSYDDIELLKLDLYKFLKKQYKKELFILEGNDKTILYDGKKKKELVTFSASSVSTYESTFIKASIKGDSYFTKEYEIYNLATGKSKVFDADADIDIYSNYLVVETEGGITYYNVNFEKVYEIKFEKEEPEVPVVDENFEEDDEDEEADDTSDDLAEDNESTDVDTDDENTSSEDASSNEPIDSTENTDSTSN